jgi:hypothetical protein
VRSQTADGPLSVALIVRTQAEAFKESRRLSVRETQGVSAVER